MGTAHAITLKNTTIHGEIVTIDPNAPQAHKKS
jgi:hypothetical protein